jgi:hypothetical protein
LRLRQGFIDGQRQALAIFDPDTVGGRFPARLIKQLFGFGRIEGQLVAEIDVAGRGTGDTEVACG